MKTTGLTAEDVDALRAALQQKRDIEARLAAILGKGTWRNKTSMMYYVLGACPQCGGDRDGEEYYCHTCRQKHARYSGARYKTRWATPAETPYNNDDH